MTWFLRGLALLLAIGAIVAAFVGYRLSNRPPPAPPAVPVETAAQAVKPLRAGEPILAQDVALRPVAVKPAGSFSATTPIVGKAPITDIAAGEVITQAHFPVTDSRLLRSLYAGERAVAIKVDDVVGLGGYAQPGDRVDILFYLRGSQETGHSSSAQVIIAGARLLSYGESLQPGPAEGESMTARAAEKLPSRPRVSTSAVLAVPETAVSRLMLAANSGALRLSLRPIEPAFAADSSDPHLVRLADLAQAARPAKEKAPAAKSRGEVITIHEGGAIRVVGAPSR